MELRNAPYWIILGLLIAALIVVGVLILRRQAFVELTGGVSTQIQTTKQAPTSTRPFNTYKFAPPASNP